MAVLDSLKRAAKIEEGDAARDRFAKIAVALATQAADDAADGADEREAHFERCAVTAAGACARSMRPNAARQVLEVAKKRAAREAGAWPKTVLYNAVLDAFEAAGRSTDALQLLDEFDRNGVPYDAVTYNIVLRLCARDGAYQRAAELLDEMVADPSPKVRPDVFSFTTAIKACCVEPKRRRRDDPAARARFALGLLSRCADANEVTFRTALRARPPARRPAAAARRPAGLVLPARCAWRLPADGLGYVATARRWRACGGRRDDVGFSAEGARAAEFFGLRSAPADDEDEAGHPAVAHRCFWESVIEGDLSGTARSAKMREVMEQRLLFIVAPRRKFIGALALAPWRSQQPPPGPAPPSLACARPILDFRSDDWPASPRTHTPARGHFPGQTAPR